MATTHTPLVSIKQLQAQVSTGRFREHLQLFIYQLMDKGIMVSLEEDGYKEFEFGVEPNGIMLSRTTAQQLMDSLYACGIRPAEGEGSAGSLKATQDHLKSTQGFLMDTQKLVDRLLKIVESPPTLYQQVESEKIL